MKSNFALLLLSPGKIFAKNEVVLLMWHENLTYPYHHKFTKTRQFWWCYSKNWTCTIIKRWIFHKNILDLMKSLKNLNCCYYHEVKFLQKVSQVYWCHLKIWPAPIITRGIFCKNKAVLMMPSESLNCPYYHEMKFLQKYPRFNKVIWTFELPALSWSIIFSNMKQFSWCHLIIWPSPIITKWTLR